MRPPARQLANHKRPRCPTRERRRQPRGPHTPGAERGAETSGRGPSADERALPEAAGGPRPRLARPVVAVAVAVETGILQFVAALGRSQAVAPVETQAEL